MHLVGLIEEVPDMDILWLAAGAAFFIGCYGLIRFFNELLTED